MRHKSEVLKVGTDLREKLGRPITTPDFEHIPGMRYQARKYFGSIKNFIAEVENKIPHRQTTFDF